MNKKLASMNGPNLTFQIAYAPIMLDNFVNFGWCDVMGNLWSGLQL